MNERCTNCLHWYKMKSDTFGDLHKCKVGGSINLMICRTDLLCNRWEQGEETETDRRWRENRKPIQRPKGDD